MEKLRDKFGRKKPFALSTDDWNDFYKKYQKEQPIAYFLLESMPHSIGAAYRKYISNRIPSIRKIIAYRITERRHLIDTGLPVGYHEIDSRMFHGMFNVLKEFVESEAAWMEFICMDEDHPYYDKYKNKFLISKYFNWFGVYASLFHDPELGIYHITKHIEQNEARASSVSERDAILRQKEQYETVLELYLWYTIERPNRHVGDDDPLINMQDREKYEKEYGSLFILSDKFKNDYPEVYQEYIDSVNKDQNNEELFYDEDTKMLKKLIDVRSTLWT